MQLTIKSKKLGRTLTFSRPGSHYIFVDLNGKEGTLGNQIGEGGCLGGSTIGYSGDDWDQFDSICRNWYKAYVKNYGFMYSAV